MRGDVEQSLERERKMASAPVEADGGSFQAEETASSCVCAALLFGPATARLIRMADGRHLR